MEIEQHFSFLIGQGFSFERDYSKGTDSTCTQIYRFRRDAANWIEFRMLSKRERSVVVCAANQKRFPSPEKKDAGFVRRWKVTHLFSGNDVWALYAALCRREIARTGTLFGLPVSPAGEGAGQGAAPQR